MTPIIIALVVLFALIGSWQEWQYRRDLRARHHKAPTDGRAA